MYYGDTLLETFLDQASQFMNETIKYAAAVTGKRHYGTIPYSKEAKASWNERIRII